MGIPLSTLIRSKYMMLPTKDNDTEVHESPIDQSTEGGAKNRSAFQSLRTFHGRYLSRETWVSFTYPWDSSEDVGKKSQLKSRNVLEYRQIKISNEG